MSESISGRSAGYHTQSKEVVPEHGHASTTARRDRPASEHLAARGTPSASWIAVLAVLDSTEPGTPAGFPALISPATRDHLVPVSVLAALTVAVPDKRLTALRLLNPQ